MASGGYTSRKVEMEGVSGIWLEGERAYQRIGVGSGGVGGEEEDEAETGCRNKVPALNGLSSGGRGNGKREELVGETESETHGTGGAAARNA